MTLRRPGIGVDDRRRAEDRDAPHAASSTSAQTGRWANLKRLRCRRAVEHPEDEQRAGGGGQHPAPERADRRQRSVAADELEGLVHRRHGLAADERPGDAAIGDEAAERDDEGRDAGIGGQHAVERADQRAQRKPKSTAMIQIDSMADAEPWAELEDLQNAHRDRDGRQHGADRQVELAHDDEQHHAGRHDGDGGCLDEQGPEIARRQERAAEQADIGPQHAAVDVEADPDHQQRRDHAEHARVEFGGAEEPRHGAFRRQGGRLARIGYGRHGYPLPKASP